MECIKELTVKRTEVIGSHNNYIAGVQTLHLSLSLYNILDVITSYTQILRIISTLENQYLWVAMLVLTAMAFQGVRHLR